MPFRKIGNFVNQKSNLRQAVGILFVTVLMSNVLGLLRNVVIANRVGIAYGSLGPLDSYYAAFALPDLLYNIVILGALASAILPLLVNFDTEDDQEGFWHTFNVLLSTGFVIMIVGVALLYLLLPILVPAFFPGFSKENLDLTLQLSKVLLLSPLIFTFSQLSTSALQAKRVFFIPALAPIIYNLAIICSALLIPKYGLSILVVGIIIGAASHFLIQLPSLIKAGWVFHFELDFKNPYLRKVVKLMLPRTIALTSTQLLLVVFYWLASSFSSGSIATYRLNDDLQTAPVLLLANTVGMAVFPDFARHVVKQQTDELQRLLGQLVRFMFYLFLPMTIFLLIFRASIIGLYISIGHSIQGGEVSLAITTFSMFVISLFFQALVLILARAFFAKSETLKPTIISLISIGLAFIFALVFTKTTNMGVAGLALAFSIGSTVNAILLWIYLKLPINILFKDQNNRHNFIYVIINSAVAGLVFLVIKNYGGIFIDLLYLKQSLGNLAQIVLGLILGMLSYWYIGKWFKLEQCNLLKKAKVSTTK